MISHLESMFDTLFQSLDYWTIRTWKLCLFIVVAILRSCMVSSALFYETLLTHSVDQICVLFTFGISEFHPFNYESHIFRLDEKLSCKYLGWIAIFYPMIIVLGFTFIRMVLNVSIQYLWFGSISSAIDIVRFPKKARQVGRFCGIEQNHRGLN